MEWTRWQRFKMWLDIPPRGFGYVRVGKIWVVWRKQTVIARHGNSMREAVESTMQALEEYRATRTQAL